MPAPSGVERPLCAPDRRRTAAWLGLTPPTGGRHFSLGDRYWLWTFGAKRKRSGANGENISAISKQARYEHYGPPSCRHGGRVLKPPQPRRLAPSMILASCILLRAPVFL